MSIELTQTIAEFCKLNNIMLPNAELMKYGKAATAECKKSHLAISKKPDKIYKEVNAYPVGVLNKLFSSHIANKKRTVSL